KNSAERRPFKLAACTAAEPPLRLQHQRCCRARSGAFTTEFVGAFEQVACAEAVGVHEAPEANDTTLRDAPRASMPA
ncbi:hypothetical protein, partial [Vibrio parahaemolyticus]|uniref:hypothetical protein n=1 Tax=Vibrio parahaemolyticus TaxID=670 RepID=UPI001A8D8A91